MSSSNDDGDMWLIFLIIFIIFIMAGSEDEKKKEAPKAQLKVEYKYAKVPNEEPKLVAPKVELGEVTEGGKVE